MSIDIRSPSLGNRRSQAAPGNLLSLTGEPTGFLRPDLVTVTGNVTDRTITLTGTTEAYWCGELVTALVPGWVSPVHAENSPINLYLGYDGTAFAWAPDWSGRMPIAIGLSNGTAIVAYIRETHGCVMDAVTHLHLHATVGTYRKSGGGLTGLTLDSATPANRRPIVGTSLLVDEDLETALPAGTASYTQFRLTGAAGADVITIGASDIIPTTGTLVNYNQWTGATWQQTSAGANGHVSVWLFAMPVTADAESQAYRYIWVQGQSTGDLASQKALSPVDLNLGKLIAVSPEMICLQQVVVRNQAGDWRVVFARSWTGTRLSLTSGPAGSFAPGSHLLDIYAHPNVDYSRHITAHPTASTRLPFTLPESPFASAGNLDQIALVKLVSAVSNPSPAIPAYTLLYAEPSTNLKNNYVMFKTDFDSENFYLWRDTTYCYLGKNPDDPNNCFKCTPTSMASINPGVMTGIGTYSGTVTCVLAGSGGYGGMLGAAWGTGGIFATAQQTRHVVLGSAGSTAVGMPLYAFRVPPGCTQLTTQCVGLQNPRASVSLYYHITNFRNSTGVCGHIRGVTAATNYRITLDLIALGILPGDDIRMFRTMCNNLRNFDGYYYCTYNEDLVTLY
jgi:hypothetical protein